MRILKVIPFERAQKIGLKWIFSKKFIAAIKHNFTFFRATGKMPYIPLTIKQNGGRKQILRRGSEEYLK